MNQFMLMGRLTRDPEVFTTEAGAQKVSLGVAENRRWENAQGQTVEETAFWTLESWDAGFVRNLPGSLAKGQTILAFGRLEPNNYSTERLVDPAKPTGKKKTIEVRSCKMRFSSVGPDLRFASAVVTKNTREDEATPAPAPAEAVNEAEAIPAPTEAPALEEAY